MTRADQLFPLHCASPKCDFNVCLECIISMLLSEADGYQLASDGSNQLKFRVRCPNCCVKYSLPRRPKQSIVPYVALLRQAYEVRDLLGKADGNLGVEAVRRKKLFLKYTTLQELKDAVDIYEDYLEMMNKAAAGKLDISDFLCLPRLKVPWGDASLFQNGEEKYLTDAEQEFLTQLLCSGDPDTVAQGVTSLQSMTKRQLQRPNPPPESREDTAEGQDGDSMALMQPHDFIAALFCGANSALASACTISNTVEDEEFDDNSMAPPPIVSPLSTMATQSTWEDPLPEVNADRPKSFSNDQLLQRMFGVPDENVATKGLTRAACSFRSMRQRTSSRLLSVATHEPVICEAPEVVCLPLPHRMPRGVEIPVYNIKGWYKPITFDKSDDTKLVMQSFRGPAKSSRLCAGDILTHIQSDSVLTHEEFDQKMAKLYEENPRGHCSLVVNADREVCDHLKTRSLLMRLMLRR